MQMNYSQEMQPAIVGMLADTTFKTTDSYHVEDEKGINAGVPVVPGTDAAQMTAQRLSALPCLYTNN